MLPISYNHNRGSNSINWVVDSVGVPGLKQLLVILCNYMAEYGGFLLSSGNAGNWAVTAVMSGVEKKSKEYKCLCFAITFPPQKIIPKLLTEAFCKNPSHDDCCKKKRAWARSHGGRCAHRAGREQAGWKVGSRKGLSSESSSSSHLQWVACGYLVAICYHSRPPQTPHRLHSTPRAAKL